MLLEQGILRFILWNLPETDLDLLPDPTDRLHRQPIAGGGNDGRLERSVLIHGNYRHARTESDVLDFDGKRRSAEDCASRSVDNERCATTGGDGNERPLNAESGMRRRQ